MSTLVIILLFLVSLGMLVASIPIMRKVFTGKGKWKWIVPVSIAVLGIFSLPLTFHLVRLAGVETENQRALEAFVEEYGASEQRISLLNRAKLADVWLFEYELAGTDQRYVALDLKELGWVELEVQ